jgi:hypothetical protein
MLTADHGDQRVGVRIESGGHRVGVRHSPGRDGADGGNLVGGDGAGGMRCRVGVRVDRRVGYRQRMGPNQRPDADAGPT